MSFYPPNKNSYVYSMVVVADLVVEEVEVVLALEEVEDVEVSVLEGVEVEVLEAEVLEAVVGEGSK